MTKRNSRSRVRSAYAVSRSKAKSKSAAARRKRSISRKISPPRGLRRDQKLDVTGVLLALIGLLILMAMFSPNRSVLIERFLAIIEMLFGWGQFVIPCAILGLGIWIVLRQFSEHLPRIGADKVLGSALLFMSGLTALHYFQFPDNLREIQALVNTGRGGGHLGGLLMQMLVYGLGNAGAGVAISACLLIALLLTLSISARQLLSGIWAGLQWLAKVVQAARSVASSRQHASLVLQDNPSLPEDPERLEAQPDDAVGSSRSDLDSDNQESPSPPAADRSAASGQEMTLVNDNSWELPALNSILDVGAEMTADDEYDRKHARLIEDTLESFGAPGRVVEVNRGPVVTQFGVEPDYVIGRNEKRTKVKVNKISALANDLALALAAPSIRIEAPVPGRGFVGIEVPNTQSVQVALRDVIETKSFSRTKSQLALALGQDVSGHAVCADLAVMPHLLIAGTTGSGKSVCINSIISTLLLHNTPDQLKLMLIDPKRVELTNYNSVPHLLAPVVVDLDRVVPSLQWIAREMDIRYDKFAKVGARNIADFNKRAGGADLRPFSNLVVVVDELADLMMIAPDETERIVTRLAQLARATGIHLIIATQRPSVDVVTGLIKANFPARISFAVTSSIDSRVILDQLGAERLLGRGDMLFLAPDAPQAQRMQGTFVSETELQRLVSFWKKASVDHIKGVSVPPATTEDVDSKNNEDVGQRTTWEEMEKFAREEERDDLYEEAAAVVRQLRKASISLLQRRLRVGYTRAAKLIDMLEEDGVVGPPKSGAQQRKVLDYGDHQLEPETPVDAP